MRESYRAKQSRKARINKEKEERFSKNKKRNNFNRDSFNKDSKKEKFDISKKDYDFPKEEKEYQDIVAGRNSVLELLKSDKDINKLYIERGEKYGSITEIIARAKENKIVTVEVTKQKLDMMAKDHQGVVAVVPPFNYSEVEDILEYAKSKKEDPFIIILDGIEDVHNLGAIIRTAETARSTWNNNSKKKNSYYK